MKFFERLIDYVLHNGTCAGVEVGAEAEAEAGIRTETDTGGDVSTEQTGFKPSTLEHSVTLFLKELRERHTIDPEVWVDTEVSFSSLLTLHSSLLTTILSSPLISSSLPSFPSSSSLICFLPLLFLPGLKRNSTTS
jgi:hypothetical protein